MNGREERKGRGRHCADATAFSPLSLFFVNGRAERLRRAEMPRLHFYEWGGLRALLRRREVQIFMNGVKMGNETVRATAMRWKGM